MKWSRLIYHSKTGRHSKTGQGRPFKIRTCPDFGSPLYLGFLLYPFRTTMTSLTERIKHTPLYVKKERNITMETTVSLPVSIRLKIIAVGIWNLDVSIIWIVENRLVCKWSGFWMASGIEMGSEIWRPDHLEFRQMAASLSNTISNMHKNIWMLTLRCWLFTS